MSFDFDTIIERRQTDCSKWDRVTELFGADDVLPMWVADADFAAPPVAMAALQTRLHHGVFGYASPSERFFASVMDWLSKRHTYAVNRDWLDVSPGVVPSLHMLVRALTAPGDAVLIQSPVYPPFTQVVEQNGRKLVNNPLVFRNGRYEMDLEDFAHKVQTENVRLMILCSPHNPVGRVWTPAELRALGELCKQHNVYVIADEIHADLILPGHTHTPFATLDDFAHFTATCLAPSKTFNIAGLQTAFTVIAEQQARAAYRDELNRAGYHQPNVFGLAATQAVYEGGAPWLDALLLYLAQNVQVIEQALEGPLSALRFTRPEGTYLAWLDCRPLGLDSDGLSAFFRSEARVGVNDGHTFGAGGDGFIRLNFGCPRAVLETGLTRIATAIERLELRT